MALDIEQEIARHQKGWDGFARFLLISTVGVIATLALLALTLL